MLRFSPRKFWLCLFSVSITAWLSACAETAAVRQIVPTEDGEVQMDAAGPSDMCPDSGPQIYDRNSGRCVECVAANNCGGLKPICRSGRCDSCRSDNDCSSQSSDTAICSATGSCVQCSSPRDCRDGNSCNASGQCVECASNAECPWARPSCNRAEGVCETCEQAGTRNDACTPTLALREYWHRMCQAFISRDGEDQTVVGVFPPRNEGSFCLGRGLLPGYEAPQFRETKVLVEDLTEVDFCGDLFRTARPYSTEDATICFGAPLRGTVEAGAECFSDLECTSGTCRGEASGGVCTGRCTVPAFLNASCDLTRCVEGLVCVGASGSRACRMGRTTGQACSLENPCSADNNCINAVCSRRFSGAVGSACNALSDCQAGLHCGSNNICVAPVANGQTCTQLSICENEGRCVQGTCVAKAAEATACSITSDCQRGLRCIEGRCLRPRGVLERCSKANQCIYGTRCVEGRCLILPRLGQRCTAPDADDPISRACETGSCVAGICQGVPVNSPCVRTDFGFYDCASGTVCAETSTGQTVCRTTLPDGAACSTTTGSPPCGRSANCFNGRCESAGCDYLSSN